MYNTKENLEKLFIKLVNEHHINFMLLQHIVSEYDLVLSEETFDNYVRAIDAINANTGGKNDYIVAKYRKCITDRCHEVAEIYLEDTTERIQTRYYSSLEHSLGQYIRKAYDLMGEIPLTPIISILSKLNSKYGYMSLAKIAVKISDKRSSAVENVVLNNMKLIERMCESEEDLFSCTITVDGNNVNLKSNRQ